MSRIHSLPKADAEEEIPEELVTSDPNQSADSAADSADTLALLSEDKISSLDRHGAGEEEGVVAATEDEGAPIAIYDDDFEEDSEAEVSGSSENILLSFLLISFRSVPRNPS